MQSNYNFSELTYNPNFTGDVQSHSITDPQLYHYNYDYNFYNAPPVPFQNLDPRLNYASQPTSYEVGHAFYGDAPQKYDLSLPVAAAEVEQKTDDELYIETWLSRIGKIQINLDSTIEILPCEKKMIACKKTPMEIGAAKLLLRKCLLIVKKLEAAHENLSSEVSSLSSAEWKNKTLEVSKLREELSSLTFQFENANALPLLQMAVKRRKKSRLNQRKRKIELRKLATKKRESRKRRHEEIDRWLEGMKDAVERAKMEENMQKDADCVLAEVTKKKSDARKQLSLIGALIKLRNTRENVAVQRGEKISLEDRAAFNKISAKLTNMWEDISKVYAKEEQGLRIMLEKNANEDGNNFRLSRDERITQQWEYILFGPKCIPSSVYYGLTLAEKDLETFVAIRKSWDTFLVPSDAPGGSNIPVGWVLPSSSTSMEWSKYLDG